MARRIGKQKIMQGLINSVYDSAIAQAQAQAQAQMQTPAIKSGMTIDQIDQIYNSAIANNQTTPQTPAQEIPKLEDNSLPSVGNPTIASELERMQKMKKENKPRSESEQRAIDTYLADLQRASAPDFKPDYQAEIERMNTLANDTATNWSEGEINARNDYLSRLQNALAEEQRKNAIVTNPVVKRSSKPSQKKTTSELVDEIVEEPKKEQQHFSNTRSANEQRDMERALQGMYHAQEVEQRKANHNNIVANAELLSGKLPEEQLRAKAEQKAQYDNLSDEGKAKVDKLNYKIASLETNKNKPVNYEGRMRKLDSDIDEVYKNDPGVANGTIEQALNPNKKLTKEEEKQFKQQIKNYEQNDVNENAYTLVFDEAHPDGMMVPVHTVDENGNYDPSKELTPEQRKEQQDIYAMKGKMSEGDAALHGMGSMIPGVSALQSVLYETDPDFRRMIDNAKTQNPVAYRGGQAAGFTMGAVESALAGGALEGTKFANALDKLGKSGGVGRRILAESLKDLPFDVVTDIIPQLLGDINAGKSGGEIALDALGNLAINQGMNTAIPFLQNFSDVRSAIRGIGKNSANVADDVVDTALNPVEMAAKNADVVDDAVAKQAQDVQNVEELVDQLPKQADNALSAEEAMKVQDIPEEKVPVEYDRTKVGSKELNSSLDSLYRMYGKEEELPLIEDLRSAINEAQQTGSEEALQRAKQIASELDNVNARRTYHTRNGNYIEFGKGNQGTYEEWLNDFENDIIGSATVKNTVIDEAEDINDMIDNFFGRYEYSPEKAQMVSDFKKAVNSVLKTGSDEDFKETADLLGDIVNEYKKAEEFVSSFKGKTKSKPFNEDELFEIANAIDARWRENLSNGKYAVSEVADDIGNTVDDAIENAERTAALSADETVSTTVDMPKKNAPEGGDYVPPKDIEGADVPEGEEALYERGTSKHIRAEDTPMKYNVPDEVKAEFDDNPDMYKRITNKETQDLADEIYDSGALPIEIDGKKYEGMVEDKFRALLDDHNPAALPLGTRLAQEQSAAGNYAAAAQIYRDMGARLTKSGQFSQAAIISMVKNDPLTAMHYAQREIDAMNKQGAKRFKNKWKNFNLTDEEIKAFNKIKPGDDKAIKELYESIGARLGKEYPTTMLDKLLEGRKVAMLFNPRTMSRNFLANPPTLGMRWLSDRVEGVGQSIVHLIDPTFEKTQAITGGRIKGRQLAKQYTQTENYKTLVNGTHGKYEVPDLKNSLMENVQMYKGTGLERWLDRMTGKGFNKAAELLGKDVRIDGGIQALNKALYGKEGVQSILETLRNTTYKALDLGDSPFVRENFIERLGSYINAQGIKNLDDIPDEAVQTAWEEAMKATYKDNSWAVKMLQGGRNLLGSIPGIGRPLSQAIIPFVQAPGNIAARMVDYSPIRGTKGVIDIISGAAKKDHDAIRRGIEEFSKGATGTGMIVLGMKLREAGILTGDYAENKRQREMQKRDGFKPWALKVGDKYFTYNWAQPGGENLIIGTLLQEAIEKSDQYDSDILRYFGVEGSKLGSVMGATWQGSKAAVNSWFDESPLQNLKELLSGGGYGKDDIAQNLADTGIGDFAGALIPAVVNAATKTNDTTKRNTYDPSNTFATFVNQQKAKLPGVSETLPVLYDAWGEEQKYANSKAESAFQRFFYPGEYGTQTDDPIDIELNRLFDSPEGTSYDDRGFPTNNSALAGDEGVFPTLAPNSVGGRKLNNEEVSAYQQDMGQRSRQMVEAFMDSELYQNMDDSQRIDALKNIYGISKAITERDLFGKPVSDTYKKKVEAFDNGNVEGVVKSFEANKLMDEAGVKSNSKIGQAITEAVESGNAEQAQKIVEDKKTLSDYGLGGVHPAVYEKAQKKFPGMSVEEFSDMYKKIDGIDGTKPNQGITQDELIPYLNKYYIPKGNAKEQAKIKADASKIWYTFQKDTVANIPYFDGEKWIKKHK